MQLFERGLSDLAYGVVFAPLWLPLLTVVLLVLVWVWRRRGVLGVWLRRTTRYAFRLAQVYRASRF